MDLVYNRLKGPVNVLYFKLNLIINLFGRKIVGWEVWQKEDAEHAKELVKRAVIKKNGKPLVLHSDNEHR